MSSKIDTIQHIFLKKVVSKHTIDLERFYLAMEIRMELAQCQQLLRQEYSKDTTVDNISKLTSVRGADKATCYTQMGGPQEIQSFLANTKNS
jgi:hypothetical protein